MKSNLLVAEIESKFNAIEAEYHKKSGAVHEIRNTRQELDKKEQHLTAEYHAHEEALDVLRQMAVIKEQVLREKIDSVVTKGLRLIFGPGYRSKLHFEISRGQATIKPKIITEVNGEELEADVAGAHGGGLVNVASVMYQIIMLALYHPRQRPVWGADEPFKNLSKEYLPAAAEFLHTLSKRLGIQVVMITHRPELHSVADKLYDFSAVNGETKIETIR